MLRPRFVLYTFPVYFPAAIQRNCAPDQFNYHPQRNALEKSSQSISHSTLHGMRLREHNRRYVTLSVPAIKFNTSVECGAFSLKTLAVCRVGNLLGKIQRATRDRKMRHDDRGSWVHMCGRSIALRTVGKQLFPSCGARKIARVFCSPIEAARSFQKRRSAFVWNFYPPP